MSGPAPDKSAKGRGIAPRAWAPFHAAVFFIFAPIMVLGFGHFVKEGNHGPALFWALVSGVIGAGFAFSFTVNMRALWFVIPFQVAMVFMFSTGLPRFLRLESRLPSVEGMAAVACIVMGYILFVRFVAVQGREVVRAQAERDLARRIHANLAPPVQAHLPRLEVFARSLPSAEMGGDLIDLVSHGDAIDLYLADVSGHGVRAGVVMAMLKSAIRARLLHGGSLAEVADALNEVLIQVKEPDMFATFAAVRVENGASGGGGGGGRRIEYAVAGHPPILLFRRGGGVEELSSGNLPLGVLTGEEYEAHSVEAGPGDLFALLTDGLIETFDRERRAFGHARIRDMMAQMADKPLGEIYAAVMDEVRAHGAQGDDQTLMLARVL